MRLLLQSGPEKSAKTLLHRHFATVCCRIMQFSPKCPEKITACQSMHNLYQLVNISLINSPNCYERRHPASEQGKPLTVDDRLLIKTLHTEKGWIVEK